MAMANSFCLPAEHIQWHKRIFRSTSGYWAGPESLNQEDWEAAFAVGNSEPLGLARGVCFVSDVVVLWRTDGTWTLVLPESHLPDEAELVKMYNEESLAHLLCKMGVSSSETRIVDRHRHFSRPRISVTVHYNGNWTAAKPINYRWAGVDNMALRDSRETNNNRFNYLVFMESNRPKQILNHILYQFIHDIFAMCPANARYGIYSTLTEQELSNIRLGYLQGNVLPLRAAHLLCVTRSKWDSILAILFPPPPSFPSPAAEVSRCTYYKLWQELMNRLDPHERPTVVESVHGFLKNHVHWLPMGDKKSIWTASLATKGERVILPANWASQAPIIAVNPTMYVSHMLQYWQLRPELQKEDEADTEDESEEPDTFIVQDKTTLPASDVEWNEDSNEEW